MIKKYLILTSIILLIFSCEKPKTYIIPNIFSENLELVLGKSLKELKLPSGNYNKESQNYEIKLESWKYFDKIILETKGINKEIIEIKLLSTENFSEKDYNLKLTKLYEKCKAIYGPSEKKKTNESSPMQMEFYTWNLKNNHITVVLMGTKMLANGDSVRIVGIGFTKFE